MEEKINNEDLRKFCNYLIQIELKGIKKEDENIELISDLLGINKGSISTILRFLNQKKAVLFKNGLRPNWMISIERCNQILHPLPI